jgi:hypothetical protein
VDAQRKVTQLLYAHGYRLKRANKHQIWENDRHNTLVVAATPSDWRAWKNALTILQRQIAGLPTNCTTPTFVLPENLSAAFDQTLGINRKPSAGGQVRPAKSKGTGFIYDEPKKVDLTPEQIEAREAKRREKRELRLQLRDIRETRKEIVEILVTRLSAMLKASRDVHANDTRLLFDSTDWMIGNAFCSLEGNARTRLIIVEHFKAYQLFRNIRELSLADRDHIIDKAKSAEWIDRNLEDIDSSISEVTKWTRICAHRAWTGMKAFDPNVLIGELGDRFSHRRYASNSAAIDQALSIAMKTINEFVTCVAKAQREVELQRRGEAA